MANLQNHKIHTVALQVDFEGMEEGLGVQDSLGLVFYEKIKPALEKVFDKYGDPKSTIVIEKLELNCGQVLYENWEEDLVNQVLIQLEDSLKSLSKKTKEIISVEKKAEEVFIHFLEKGFFPWNSSFANPRELENSLLLDKKLLEKLSKLLRKSSTIRQRLFNSFSSSFISNLTIAWSRKSDSKTSMLVHHFIREENPLIWQALFKILLPSTATRDTLSILSALKTLIQHISKEELLVLAEFLSLKMKENQEFQEAWVMLLSEVSDESFQIKTKVLWKNMIQIDPDLISGFKTSFPDLDWETMDFRTTDGKNDLDKLFEKAKKNLSLIKNEILNRDNTSDSNRENIDFSEEIFVENAGMVLLHPFIAGLFSNLQLTENGKFIAESDQSLAARILQNLVYGENEMAENFYPLNKIICGMGITQILGEKMEISQEIKMECEDLLQAVIGHWSVLKNTSIEGLRETFLQRTGKITRVEKGWRLQVERKTVDVLLAKLPWGMGIIKLPWMDEMMFVEWE
jgi:hypothetical protein